MSEVVRTSKDGTSRCTTRLVERDGRWRAQVRFDAEGVDWFSITWDEADLEAHIETLETTLALARTMNSKGTS